MVSSSPEELVEAATGNIKKKHLTKDSGMLFTYLYDGPLLDHLNDGEQPEYIFSNENKGYRITEPDGDERTPHHTGFEGRRYLLVTDQRVLYVAGGKRGDEIIECDYDEITDIERLKFGNIQFNTTDGRTYKFVSGSSKGTVNSAVDYISERTVGTTSGTTGEKGSNKSDQAYKEQSGETNESTKLDKTEKETYKYDFTAHINSHNLQSADESESNPTDLSEQFSSTNSYGVFIDELGIEIYDGAYRVGFDEVAEVQEFEDGATVSGPEGVYETKAVGVKMVTGNNGELRIYESYIGPAPAPELTFSEEISQYIQDNVKEMSSEDLTYNYSLCDRLKIERPDLKVEGWTDGSSNVNANIDASASSKGESRGIEIGPFTRSKTSSKSSIEGEISGDISDNTYTTKVNSFKLYDDYLSIESDINIDLYYSDIENVFKHDGGGMTKQGNTLVKPGDGVIIQDGQTTFRIEDLSEDAPIEEGIDFVRSKMEQQKEANHSDDSDDKITADKIRELRDLYEDGILTEEEFESKKQEFLDDF